MLLTCIRVSQSAPTKVALRRLAQALLLSLKLTEHRLKHVDRGAHGSLSKPN
jgi:hypothetical protein